MLYVAMLSRPDDVAGFGFIQRDLDFDTSIITLIEEQYVVPTFPRRRSLGFLERGTKYVLAEKNFGDFGAIRFSMCEHERRGWTPDST